MNTLTRSSIDVCDHQAAHGQLALTWCGKRLPLVLMESAAGFYIGTFDPESGPCSRESQEYFKTREKAQAALSAGTWTQRLNP